MPALLDAPARRTPQTEGDFVVFDDVPVLCEASGDPESNWLECPLATRAAAMVGLSDDAKTVLPAVSEERPEY